MVNSYILGRSREYNLLSKLRKNNWFAIRGAGSKAGMVKVNDKKYFPIDIVSIKKDKGKMTKIWFIQVSKYLTDIDKIEKNKATVNYGMFTSNVNLDLLELVERAK